MGDRGNVVVALLFTLLLATSGLALLTHTGYHLKIIAARKDKRLQTTTLEQALLLGLHCYREKLTTSNMNAYAEPQTDFFNNTVFPDWSENEITGTHEFSCRELRSEESYRVVRIHDIVRVRRQDGRLEYSGRAGVDLVAGDIPAEEFGLLVARKNDAAAATFLAARKVDYAGSQLPLVSDFAVTADTKGMLAKALGIEIPDWRRIREKFGLELSDEPIPSGVYLARDEKDIHAVFVEGDLDKLAFAASGGWQSIVFSQAGHNCELRYQPGLESVYWSGSGDVAGARFGEKIIVHGSVWAIEQAEATAFLAAARIELLACGRLVVRSGLESENLASGKGKLPGLLLMTCGRDFFSDEEINADVVIDVRDSVTIQAQVISAGTLVNGDASVEITGSLLARDIENAGNLRIGATGGNFTLDDRVLLHNFKFLKNFRVHFIEENSYEE